MTARLPMSALGLSFLLSLALAPPQIAAARSLRAPPVDDCAADSSFAAFRTKLGRVIAARDAKRLLELVDEDVEVNFGGDHGREDFARVWRLEEPGESPLWKELEAALALGCAPDHDAFVSPSLFAQAPVDMDPFETFLALPGATLRGGAGDRFPAIEKLDWQLVSRIADHDERWMHVKLGDGRAGFVPRQQLRSVIDYRIHFEKRGGRWLITSVLAGD